MINKSNDKYCGGFVLCWLAKLKRYFQELPSLRGSRWVGAIRAILHEIQKGVVCSRKLLHSKEILLQVMHVVARLLGHRVELWNTKVREKIFKAVSESWNCHKRTALRMTTGFSVTPSMSGPSSCAGCVFSTSLLCSSPSLESRRWWEADVVPARPHGSSLCLEVSVCPCFSQVAHVFYFWQPPRQTWHRCNSII